MTIVYTDENSISTLGVGDLETTEVSCYLAPTSIVVGYPSELSLVDITERLVAILYIELPEPSTNVDLVLLTLAGEYLVTLNGEHLAYV